MYFLSLYSRARLLLKGKRKCVRIKRLIHDRRIKVRWQSISTKSPSDLLMKPAEMAIGLITSRGAITRANLEGNLKCNCQSNQMPPDSTAGRVVSLFQSGYPITDYIVFIDEHEVHDIVMDALVNQFCLVMCELLFSHVWIKWLHEID